MSALIELSVPLALLALGYVAGSIAEQSHYKSIRVRELRHRRMPTTNLRQPPPHWQIQECAMVAGSTVVSVDYFKRFLAQLRNFFGGRVRAYESLLDRARREALLRMKNEATERGYDAVINVRIETSNISSPLRNNGKGTAGIEVLAFGTALKLAR
ncbi:MAG: YbjQ family protein [Myxococcota bacterium]